jgi:enamine deaminase RidA (YjgF/YER057c/UK114 family)
MKMMTPLALSLSVAMLTGAAHAADPVVRAGSPTAAIAQSVAVPSGYKTIYVSGLLPDVADPAAPKGSYASYGNTETQSLSIFKKMEAALKVQGAGLGDIVSMKVYLTGDPALGGKMDFAGMMKAYLRYFGTPEQPNKPARATIQVADLVATGFLAEIEAIAVLPEK